MKHAILTFVLTAAACADSLPTSARTVDRILPLAKGAAFDRKHPPKIEGREIVCDNGESTKLRSGWTWPVKLAQTNALPFSVPFSTVFFWKPTISVMGPSAVPMMIPMSALFSSVTVIFPSASALMPLISWSLQGLSRIRRVFTAVSLL